MNGRAMMDMLGMAMPSRADLILTGVAIGVCFIAYAIARQSCRLISPVVARLWEERVGEPGRALTERIAGLLRNLIVALILAPVLAAYRWPPLAILPLGIMLGVAVGLFVRALLRAALVATPIANGLAVAVFVAVLAGAAGGLAPVGATLDSIGLSIGERRITLLGVLTVVVIVVALYAGVRLANRVVAQSVRRARSFDAAQRLLIEKLAGVALIVAAFFIGIDLIGIDLTALAVFSGGLGLAVGFGLQKTVGNLFAGIILLMDRSIKPGDVIVVGESFGWVDKIGVRAVSVITRDGKEHLIPNENLMTQEVENWSFSDRNVRIHIPLTVAYSADHDKAKVLMLQAALETERVLDDQPANVWTTALGDNGIEYDILIWIADPENGVGNVKSDVLNRVWALFSANGIEVPYPQTELRFRGPSPAIFPAP